MIQIQQIKLPVGHSKDALMVKVSKILRIPAQEIQSIQILKQSIDARKKPELFFSYVVEVETDQEAAVVKRARSSQVSLSATVPYTFPDSGGKKLEKRPVIIGMGPAGLFCGYFLAKYGYRPIILERGEAVEERMKSVADFWEGGTLNPDSNVQFGEGGAGTFSDGKLNTLMKDKFGRNQEVLRIFVQAGAPEAILYESKPHIGTDLLRTIVRNIRKQIKDFGGEVHFLSKVTDLVQMPNQEYQLTIAGGKPQSTQVVVLAVGHSARDTFQMLYKNGFPMEPKSFAVGLRVEHPQGLINMAQYGIKDTQLLGAAPYKLTAQSASGRGVYSFCMCPGGYVVNASSEARGLAVNGMSYSGRDSSNANSAVIVSVTPQDFESSHPLAGITFQQKLEERAYAVGSGRIPAESFQEFSSHATEFPEKEINLNGFSPSMKGAYVHGDVRSILPESLNDAFIDGMKQFERMIPGFAGNQVIVSGVESRTSSPVRIPRDEHGKCQGNLLYPCGEGAGYAGGITSAAMDGIKAAEKIAKEFAPFTRLM